MVDPKKRYEKAIRHLNDGLSLRHIRSDVDCIINIYSYNIMINI